MKMLKHMRKQNYQYNKRIKNLFLLNLHTLNAMSKRILFFIGLLSLLLLSSCFEIVEEVTFNKDGSGSVTLTMNLSKSKTKLKSIMLLDSVNNYKVPSKAEIQREINTAIAKVKKIKGISNVKNTTNFDEYIFTVSCNFTDVDALNNVIVAFSSKKDAMAVKKHKHFKFNKATNTFTRSHHFNLGKEFGKTKVEDRKVFETATFTSIYRFKNAIVASQNKDAKIAGSKKAIMLRLNAQDIIKGRKTIKNKITLQN